MNSLFIYLHNKQNILWATCNHIINAYTHWDEVWLYQKCCMQLELLYNKCKKVGHRIQLLLIDDTNIIKQKQQNIQEII